MKDLGEYIFLEGFMSPDEIEYGNKYYRYFVKNANPFLLNEKTNFIKFGKAGTTHGDTISELSDDELDNFDMNSIWDRPDHVVLGRVWAFKKGKSRENVKRDFLVIAFWGGIESNKLKTFINTIITDYFKNCKPVNKIDKSIYTLFIIDNNGDMYEYSDDKPIILKPQDEEAKKRIAELKAIHLASQKEKRDFFNTFRQNRDTENQTKKYNHTKSRTEAEYRSIRYQGDSLNDTEKNIIYENMKNLVDYINEKESKTCSDCNKKCKDDKVCPKCGKNPCECKKKDNEE